jgi:hypothetical protein
VTNNQLGDKENVYEWIKNLMSEENYSKRYPKLKKE